MSETCSRAHLKNQRRARPSDATRSAAPARSAGTSVVDLREERASDVRRDPPAARRSQPAMVLAMRPRPYARLAVACVLGFVATAAAPSAPAKDAIAKTTEVGPVKATIKVWPAKPTLGDAIYARLEIDAPSGITLDAPFQEIGRASCRGR